MPSSSAVGMAPRAAAGLFVALLAAGCSAAQLSRNGGFDHRSHSKPGAPRTVYENPPDSGFALVQLDGSLSHSHYFVQGPPLVTGIITVYRWTNTKSGTLIAEGKVAKAKFPVGTTSVELFVKDQTGDSHSATTSVTVLPSQGSVPGVMTYFYDVPTRQQHPTSRPGADYAEWRPNTAIWNHLNIPPRFRWQDDGAVRMVTSFAPRHTGRYQFKLSYSGGQVNVFCNKKRVAGGNADVAARKKELWFTLDTVDGKFLQMEFLLTRRFVSFHIVLYSRVPASKSNPTGTPLVVVHPSRLNYEPRHVVPTIQGASIQKSRVEGGETLELAMEGLAGVGDITVSFTSADGKETRDLDITGIDAKAKKVLGLIPRFGKAGPATVIARTSLKGVSNRMPFEFQADTLADGIIAEGGDGNLRNGGGGKSSAAGLTQGATGPIDFREDELKHSNGKRYQPPRGITSIVRGPDSRYYMGSLGGIVQVLTVATNSLTVTATCASPKVSKHQGSILGLAIDPTEKYIGGSVTLYMTVSVLSLSSKKTPLRWNNGQVLAYKSVEDGDKRCMVFDRRVVTGLPVSDKDHAVNALAFDANGDLFITVGSSTNAGIADPSFGSLDESVLSASVVRAQISKPGFNGDIKYTQLKDAGSARQISGDVRPYSTGLRNSFGLTFHSNGGLYCTDNGMNPSFGDTSFGCVARKAAGNELDKLIRLRKNKYFGHPNRARRECDSVPEAGALGRMESSTTGLIEYTASVFGGKLLRNLFMTKFAGQGSGTTSRAVLDGKGTGLNGGILKVSSVSGLSIVMGPRGELLMPQVQQRRIRVLVPRDSSNSGRDGSRPVLLTVTPHKGPRNGGNIVRIAGHNLGGGVDVTINGKKCQDVSGSNVELTCVAPAGRPGAARVVVWKGGQRSISYGLEYYYTVR